MTEAELIQRCKKGDRQAQRDLYQRYSPKMYGVCMRYLKNREDAEDVLIEGMFKVFAHLDSYKGAGSFEGWIRRIVVNEALMHLRKRHNFNLTVEVQPYHVATKITAQDKMQERDILKLLDQLPTGYRTVFNMYIIEGYKHREIADLLGISINTSKSQLILAKKKLQSLMAQQQHPDVG